MRRISKKLQLSILGWVSFFAWLVYCNLFAKVEGFSLLDRALRATVSLPDETSKCLILLIATIPALLFAYGVSLAIVSTKLFKSLFLNEKKPASKGTIWTMWAIVFIVMLYGQLIINFGYNF